MGGGNARCPVVEGEVGVAMAKRTPGFFDGQTAMTAFVFVNRVRTARARTRARFTSTV